MSNYFLIGSELGELWEMGCYLLVFTQSLQHLCIGIFDAPLPFRRASCGAGGIWPLPLPRIFLLPRVAPGTKNTLNTSLFTR